MESLADATSMLTRIDRKLDEALQEWHLRELHCPGRIDKDVAQRVSLRIKACKATLILAIQEIEEEG